MLEAKSGTGKTAVFSIIALEKLDLQKGLQTIILTPTREIAAQVCDVIKLIGCSYEGILIIHISTFCFYSLSSVYNFKCCFFTGLQVEVVMGGLPVQDDIAKFKKKVHILVGSPGRLRQLVQEKHVTVTSVRLLVLDEADRLVDKSFVADINYIFSSLPQEKQVIMSSATYTEKAKEAISKYLRGAQHICPDTDSVLLGIEQRIILVKYNVNIVKQTNFRFQELLKILSRKPFKQCIVFCNYQTRVAEVGKMLKKEKWPAEQLYGQQNQTDRLEALKTLQDYGCRILVSTDLAARGIDASNVDLVINFEPPFEWQTYLHRIGRAGRFGSYGVAVTLLSEGQEENKFKTMLEEIKGSINLKEFWDDETFVADVNLNMTNFTQLELNTPEIVNGNGQIFQNFWDTLTSPSKKDSKEIESFETLGSINEMKEIGIKSFSDLLNSFNMHEPNNNINEESPYQCLSLPDIPTAEYCAIINNIHTKTDMSVKDIIVDEKCQRQDEDNAVDINNEILNATFKELNINPKLASMADNNIERLDNLEKEDNINNEYELQYFKLTEVLHRAQLSGLFESSQDRKSINSQLSLGTEEDNTGRIDDLQNQNNDYKTFDFEDREIQDAMRAAGLPTAFSSTKHTTSHRKRFYKANKKFIENRTCRTLSSNSSKQNNICYNDFHNSDTNEIAGAYGVSLNDPVNEYSIPLEFNEPNKANHFRHKNKPNCFNNTSQNKFDYNHIFTNPLQSSNVDDYVVKDNVCSNTSQYHRSETIEYTLDPIEQNNSNTSLYGLTTKYGKQDDAHNATGPSNPKYSKETSDEDTESDSHDEPTLPLEYVNWYKTLKHRTLQVQLAVYVDELSKL